MKKICLIISICFALTAANAQSGSVAAFDKKLIRTGRSEMGYYIVNGGGKREICSFIIDVNNNNKTLSVFTTLQFLNSTEKWVDTSISDANTFKPIYRSSFSKDNEYALKYGTEVTGYHFNKQTKKKTAIKESVNQSFIDSYTYPYLLGLLPLTTGYKKELTVYEYKPENDANLKKAFIKEVKSNVHVSEYTGEHKVWQVTVLEEASNDLYNYYIDKENRRIWKVELTTKNQQILLLDKEADFNPVKSKFDYASTIKLVTAGNSVIMGQAFARDNHNGGMLRGMAVLNVNKKQFASPGTGIVLIPYTPYFKEWLKVNDELRKNRRIQIPLAEQAKECIKVTTVYDEKGNFEFVNLMPGEYLLYTQFSYIHRASQTEVVGYTDTYINGMYQGSNANTETYNFNANASAFIKKVITIKKDGEKQEIKLKKTL